MLWSPTFLCPPAPNSPFTLSTSLSIQLWHKTIVLILLANLGSSLDKKYIKLVNLSSSLDKKYTKKEHSHYTRKQSLPQLSHYTAMIP